MLKNKIIIFNPRSANAKHRIPNSILQVGASIHGVFDYVFVDGNLERDPWKTIENYFKTGEFKYFCSTVMPGPQLKQAIPFTKKIKEEFPELHWYNEDILADKSNNTNFISLEFRDGEVGVAYEKAGTDFVVTTTYTKEELINQINTYFYE